MSSAVEPSSRPIVAVSMGDPLGIGPEVIVKALADRTLRRMARYHVHGTARAMDAAAEAAGISPFWWRVAHASPVAGTCGVQDVVVMDYPEFDSACDAPGTGPEATRAGGEASFRFVEAAMAACGRGVEDAMRARAIVTAPISKLAWDMAGHGRYPGHTELLAERLTAKRSAMFFLGPRLRVVLATVHIPLSEVVNELTIGRVVDAIELGHEACVSLGIARPRVAVCGLNPHAGEGGLLGDEEERIIGPAIEACRRDGKDIRGPLPGDSVFLDAVKPPERGGGKFDLFVAMYHDQGLIPVKLLDRDETVNVTLGLGGGVVRTSPAHGTAFDIAGRNLADASSMHAALKAAVELMPKAAAGRR